ncbi:MAG: asparagine synthetase B, partial [bacterium]|nr:asparagine synthetase B [bacterium]
MCGICGIFDLKQEKRVDASIVKRMTSTLFHRGPDGENHFVDGNLGYGFTRLSIIDLEGGMQPLFNEDRSIVLICNGEIFNYIELRKELIKKGHRFKTQTDVEVLIHLYEEKGTEFINELNGQFAFAIFDFKKQQLSKIGEMGEITDSKDETYYAEKLKELVTRSVKLRLRSDVPVGYYISGGLDSSITSAIGHQLLPSPRAHSFAIDFVEKDISESKYQRIMSQFVNSIHHEIVFQFSDISNRLPKAVLHSECALKETYNTASMALSESVRAGDIKVILTGEGSDEIFAGYVGYRFDKMRQMQGKQVT